jgi:hypothetical protein
MSDVPRKRPWLQFHLSTAVVLMFVAAGLLWLNIMGYRSRDEYIIEHGWPVVFYIEPRQSTEVLDAAGQILIRKRDSGEPYQLPRLGVIGVSRRGIAINLGFDVLLLALSAYAAEWLIRRKERRP